MTYRNLLRIFALLGSGFGLSIASAQTESLIYNFTGGPDGGGPQTGLLYKAGNFYGAAVAGGNLYGGAGCGVVFRTSKAGLETVLWTFQGYPNDGCGPEGSLAIDSQGNLYGVTVGGGPGQSGTIFKVTPSSRTETILYYFLGGQGVTNGDVAIDLKHNLLYTTALLNPPQTQWSILKLDLTTNAVSTFYTFGNTSNGIPIAPVRQLTVDGSGNVYGATDIGGTLAFGSVFRITPAKVYKDIYSFQNQSDGLDPNGGVVFYKGNLYGVTGPGPSGTSAQIAYKLTMKGVITPIYTFAGCIADQPVGELSFDTSGNIYGLAWNGPDLGDVYKLTPSLQPPYTCQPLHTFAGPPSDGSDMVPQRLAVVGGNVYGTTHEGGKYCDQNACYGTVFKIVP